MEFEAAITPQLITNILLILTVAWVFGAISMRLGLPVMIGELLAGVILGPPLLGLITASQSLELMAEFGIFFAMFYAGMEMDPRELLEHIWPSLAVALGGFILPFALGYLTVMAFGGTVYQSLFVGMGLSVTAIAVQAIVLENMRLLKSNLGHIIIGAAIVDDILSLVALSVLSGLARSGSVQVMSLLTVLLKVCGFFGITILLGHFVVPKITRKLEDYGGKGFTFALVSALVMAYLAELAGLHLIIGAFLAGQFVRKEIMDTDVYDKIRDRFFAISYGFLTPIFFVSLSFHLHFEWNLQFIGLVAAIFIVAVMGKLIGSGLGGVISGHSIRQSVILGFGMNGRGAVELVVAAVVIKLSNELMANGTIGEPLLTQGQFSALVLMAFATTLLAPITLKWSVRKTCSSSENESFCELWRSSTEL